MNIVEKPDYFQHFYVLGLFWCLNILFLILILGRRL